MESEILKALGIDPDDPNVRDRIVTATTVLADQAVANIHETTTEAAEFIAKERASIEEGDLDHYACILANVQLLGQRLHEPYQMLGAAVEALMHLGVISNEDDAAEEVSKGLGGYL